MAGPVDARVNPTKVNELATERPMSWFERNLIDTVPPRYRGAGRRVYPGFMQLLAFMSMNARPARQGPSRSASTISRPERARKRRRSRPSTTSISPCSTCPPSSISRPSSACSRRRSSPRGELIVRDRRVDPRAIRRTALLTVEGERDDICAVGQTLAAHDLCASPAALPASVTTCRPAAGHYGVFSGTRWETQIYPVVRNSSSPAIRPTGACARSNGNPPWLFSPKGSTMKLFKCQHCGQLLYFENTRVRALFAQPRLSAGDRTRSRPLSRKATHGARSRSRAVRTAFAPTPPTTRATGWCRPTGRTRTAWPAVTTAPFRTSRRRRTCCPGASWKPPSTACFTPCFA